MSYGQSGGCHGSFLGVGHRSWHLGCCVGAWSGQQLGV